MCKIEKDVALQILRNLLLIREVEKKIIHLFSQRQMRCPVHLSIGEEASAVGICQVLKRDDMVFSNHRCHAHYLAKGGDVMRMFAELYGRDAGCCSGMGGSMHLVDQSVNMMGSSSIVASSIPIAVGAAWKKKLENSQVVTVAFFGDAAMEEGVVYESMNFAALHGLSVIFVCEDNGLATYTPIVDRQPNNAIAKRAQAFMYYRAIKRGDDCAEIFGVANEIITNKQYPAFIHVPVVRFTEHVGPKYETEVGVVDSKNIQHQMDNFCPVIFWERYLSQSYTCVTQTEIQDITLSVEKIIDDAVIFAQRSAFPKQDCLNKITWEVRQ